MFNNVNVSNTSYTQQTTGLPTTSLPPTGLPTTTSNSGSIKNDNTSWSSVATSTMQSNGSSGGPSDPNLQAGFAKKFFSGLGNMFGKVADLVGMGTYSRIAKNQFIQNDLDKNNSLNAQEFTAVGQMIQKSFQTVDRNNNGQISLGEFKTVVKDIVDAEMKMTDTSGDGFVNYNEAMARGLVNNSGPQDSFRRNDVNQDGLLSKNEFANLIEEQKIRKK